MIEHLHVSDGILNRSNPGILSGLSTPSSSMQDFMQVLIFLREKDHKFHQNFRGPDFSKVKTSV